MFYRVKEASAPVICGSVHPHEASWSLILSPHLDIRGSELCAVLATSSGWQLLSGRLIESQRSTTAKGCMPEACIPTLHSWYTSHHYYNTGAKT